MRTAPYVLAWLLGIWNLAVVVGLFIPALPWSGLVTSFAGINLATWAVCSTQRSS